MAYQLPSFGYRPFNTFLNALSVLYVDPAGSDANPGTAGQPLLTWNGLQARIAQIPSGQVTINWATGTYAIPSTLSNINFQTHVGTLTNQLDGTVSVVVAASDTQAVIVDVTGLAVAADALRGRAVNYPNSGNRVGVCYRNDATTAGITRLYLTQSPLVANLNGSIVAPLVGDIIQLFTRGVTFTMAAETVIESSTSSTFQNIRFTGPSVNRTLYVLASDKPQFLSCSFSALRQLRAGTAGRMHLDACYVATAGLPSAAGMLAASNGGTILIQRGTVVDGVNAIANADFVAAIQTGTLAFRNLSVFRDLTDAVRIVGGNLVADTGLGPEDGIFFENASGAGATNGGSALVVNENTADYVGNSGQLQAVNFHGAVLGAYAVEAQRGAYVALGSTGSLTTATVTNAVSADGGLTATAWGFDGTQIFGGNPARPPRSALNGPFVSVAAGPYTASAGQYILFDPSGGTFQINFPLTANLVAGDSIITQNSTSSATAVTISGNGNNVANVQTAPGTYSASTTLGNAGVYVLWTWTGTNWVAS